MDSTVSPSQAPGGVQSLLCKRLEFPEAAPFQIPVFLDALAEADSIAGAAYDASVSPGEVRVFACMEDAACVSNMGTKLTVLLGSLSTDSAAGLLRRNGYYLSQDGTLEVCLRLQRAAMLMPVSQVQVSMPTPTPTRTPSRDPLLGPSPASTPGSQRIHFPSNGWRWIALVWPRKDGIYLPCSKGTPMDINSSGELLLNMHVAKQLIS
jgi:hypothetical protein